MEIKIKAKDISENEVSFSLVQGSVVLESNVATLKIEKEKNTEKVNYSVSLRHTHLPEIKFDNQDDALGHILEKITNTYIKTGLQSALDEGIDLLKNTKDKIEFIDPLTLKIKKKKNVDKSKSNKKGKKK